MDSNLPFDEDTEADLLANQKQRVAVGRRLLAAHRAGDREGMREAQSELSRLSTDAVEIQLAGMRRAQGAA